MLRNNFYDYFQQDLIELQELFEKAVVNFSVLPRYVESSVCLLTSSVRFYSFHSARHAYIQGNYCILCDCFRKLRKSSLLLLNNNNTTY